MAETTKKTGRKPRTTSKKETKIEEKVEVKEEEKVVEEPALAPAEYFAMVKEKVHDETPENVKLLFNTCMKQLKRYMVTGQKVAAKELYAKCLYLEKEIKVLEKGITKYVLRNDVDHYIDDVADKCVCIIEMENFERPIPDEIVDIVADTMDVFDAFFVLFTDYTGEKRSKVKKERRDKDPIMFGTVLLDGKVGPKLYYLGDWVDDYCDLTLDKMIEDITKKDKKSKEDILFNISDFSILDNVEKELFGTEKRVTARNVEINKDDK